ncbi:MAG: hypothetical protein A2Z25_18070 [Planctomycetes bacterium RBG_16_55_9]|nr:MAG: hypothetical protein A2Z25_18070 [Planctomycetes bacterium RBG_16_55_9]
MKALQDKNLVLWLVGLLGIVSAIVLYRIGFNKPIPAFNEEALQSLLPADPFSQEDLIFDPATAADFKRESIKEPRYGTKNPLYFRVLFGKEAANPMMGVVDESHGTGAGYDVVYIDENMNGDLTDDTTRKFSRRESGNQAGELEPKFEFWGPFDGQDKAKYAINIYSLTPRYSRSVKDDQYYFFSYMDIGDWYYYFINGKIKLFPSLEEALKGTPALLGGECRWQINSRIQEGKSLVSAGLKDINGCTLRVVTKNGQMLSPSLTLLKDSQVVAEEKMKFG